MAQKRSILEEAQEVVEQRQTAYGSREDNFGRIAALWSAILGIAVTPRQVALCMICVKIARECWKPSRDSRVDLIGYTMCLEDLVQQEDASRAWQPEVYENGRRGEPDSESNDSPDHSPSESRAAKAF